VRSVVLEALVVRNLVVVVLEGVVGSSQRLIEFGICRDGGTFSWIVFDN